MPCARQASMVAAAMPMALPPGFTPVCATRRSPCLVQLHMVRAFFPSVHVTDGGNHVGGEVDEEKRVSPSAGVCVRLWAARVAAVTTLATLLTRAPVCSRVMRGL